ncbi:H-type small acid-soluble spore protein [Heliorestis acidaminivorans]|uniref:H-type small acid-soluble spore protein n=1 Tax=Heliorestis acidaminivorans TaxID=553427 RepID=A0A6I0F5C7_9FIRM|nr:H-type small acid-soluble spore protein [Heliorestis acidaminivorans]KAB2952519.1 H-type small acid-soluble spore protein [Heliorestis acidaminivorans]
MEAQRAEEILQSPDTIEVQYQQSSVWIEEVNRQKETAQVKLLEEGKRIEVPVATLEEKA